MLKGNEAEFFRSKLLSTLDVLHKPNGSEEPQTAWRSCIVSVLSVLRIAVWTWKSFLWGNDCSS